MGHTPTVAECGCRRGRAAPVAVLVHGGLAGALPAGDLMVPLAEDLNAAGGPPGTSSTAGGRGGRWPETFDDIAAASPPCRQPVDLGRLLVIGHSAGVTSRCGRLPGPTALGVRWRRERPGKAGARAGEDPPRSCSRDRLDPRALRRGPPPRLLPLRAPLLLFTATPTRRSPWPPPAASPPAPAAGAPCELRELPASTTSRSSTRPARPGPPLAAWTGSCGTDASYVPSPQGTPLPQQSR